MLCLRILWVQRGKFNRKCIGYVKNNKKKTIFIKLTDVAFNVACTLVGWFPTSDEIKDLDWQFFFQFANFLK